MEIELNEKNFQNEVLSSDKPVLVDFWAAWCGPCLMLAPMIERIAEKYEGKVKVGRVNVDENLSLAYRYGIRAIPTVIIFHKGKAVRKLVGVRSEAEYSRELERLISEDENA